jgi:hypothetical protein
MVGSPLVGGVVAQLAFWVLLTLGIMNGALSRRRAAVFVSLWLAGYLALPWIGWWTAPLVSSWVAVLDIALVFMLYKGDVRLT